MKNILNFNKFYFVCAVLLFGTEVCIALFVHDYFIRPYFGDVLVVMLIYCFVKSFINTRFLETALAVLAFSYGIEFLQYLQIVKKLGLENSVLASTVIGTSFAWLDMLAYTVGIVIVICLEMTFSRKPTKQKV